MAYVATPAATTLGPPTASDVATYQTGPDRFPNLGTLGSFRNFNITALGADQARFNCFAWSVGFTDRWIQGGTKDVMVRLYEAYMFKQCTAAQAEVELYAITGAPETLSRTIRRRGQPDRVIEYPNGRSVVMHAHRRDHPNLDATPNQGCSSKMAAGPLIAHNRAALADNRTWTQSGNPQICYGAIYQWWQRDPAAHPTLPGNAANQYPVPGHYPDDRIYEAGYGTYPPGHPNNTVGLPGAAGNNNATPGATTTLARRPGSSASSASSTTTASHSRASSQTSINSANSKAAAAAPAKPWVFLAESKKAYTRIPLIGPYARIPAASAAAVAAAKAYQAAVLKANPKLVAAFNAAWTAFMTAWQQLGQACDDASVCMQTPEAVALLKLATAATVKDVIALVVHRLATEPKSFVGVYVYNRLERDRDFLVHQKDLFNFNVLQRHANVVVEMNAERKAPVKK